MVKRKNLEKKEVENKKKPASGKYGKTQVKKGDVFEKSDDTVTDEPKAMEKKAPDTETAVSVENGAELKLAEINEKYVRLLAEYDNYRKRTVREIENLIKFASEKLIIELLPILDNLDRATEHRNDKTSYEEYVKGIAIIEDQFREVLARASLEPIETIGKPFDPELHDAIMQLESDEYETGIISAEVEKGYMLSGKVIRHSKVVVSK